MFWSLVYDFLEKKTVVLVRHYPEHSKLCDFLFKRSSKDAPL